MTPVRPPKRKVVKKTDGPQHRSLERERIGVAFMTFYGLLWIAGGNDLVATHFGVSLNHVTWFLRFAVILGPVLAFWIARRWAISLQGADQARLLHGLETGIITRSPKGEYTEKHQPVSVYEAYSLTARDGLIPYKLESETDDNGVRAPRRALNKARATLSRFYD